MQEQTEYNVVSDDRPFINMGNKELSEFLEMNKADHLAMLKDPQVTPFDKAILDAILQEPIRAAELEKILRN